MKIGIISDIHDNILNLRKAIKILNKKAVKKVYFCGDLVSPFTIKEFQALKVPIKAVFGNNEGDLWGIMRRLKKYNIDIEYEEKQGKFFQDKIRRFNIAVFHGNLYPITKSLVIDDKYNLLLTGHTQLFIIILKNLKIKSGLTREPSAVSQKI